MENIKKSLKNFSNLTRVIAPAHPLLLQLNSFLGANLLPGQSIVLALSGGLDSSVLLHLLAESRRTLPFNLYAMHVHHGLSSNSDEWAEFCLQQCSFLDVPLEIRHVNVERDSKLGIEATARKLRYEVLFNYKLNNVTPDFIVTAHHQDDQAETILLQLFRGSGVKGLSSMAPTDNARRLLRPLLDVPHKALQEFANNNDIKWCDDESNENIKFDRNFVRHEVLPVLEKRFPAIKLVLARTASHLAEANDLLDSLAMIDSQILIKENSIDLQGLSKLDTPRVKNLLRWWFSQNQLAMPNSDHLSEIVQQLLTAKHDANLSIQLQHLTIKRFQNRAYLCHDQIAQPFDLVWNGEPQLILPNGSQLQFNCVYGKGLAIKLGMTKLRITNRDGGERFKPNILRPTRTLKHLLQEANIPPWQRIHLPLIYWHDTLAYVPGIGAACELQAAEHEQGLEIKWKDEAI